MSLHDRFEAVENESHRFERVQTPASTRPDVCAFVMLTNLLGGNRDLVDAAEHDQIWLDVDPDELDEKADDEFILTLVRCGVWYDSGVDRVSLFV